MERTQATALRVLGRSDLSDDGDDYPTVVLEPRLREVAKGAREGQPKWMTQEQALNALKKKYREETNSAEKKEEEEEIVVPKLETEQQVWDRLDDWLQETVLDIVKASELSTVATAPVRDGSTPATISTDNKNGIVNVLCISHSGTLRTLLCRLVPTELPTDIDISRDNFQNTQARRLRIPNTSVTIVDIALDTTGIQEEKKNGKTGENDAKTLIIGYTLRLLTWDGHVEELGTEAQAGINEESV